MRRPLRARAYLGTGAVAAGVVTHLRDGDGLALAHRASTALRKRALCQRCGVATYRVVDPDARMVEVWRPDRDRPEIVTDMLRWQVTPDASDLAVDAPSLFVNLPA